MSRRYRVQSRLKAPLFFTRTRFNLFFFFFLSFFLASRFSQRSLDFRFSPLTRASMSFVTVN